MMTSKMNATAPAGAGRMSLTNITRGKQDKPLRAILYGVEGVGKSTFASQAPSPIFLCSEDGTSQLDVARFPSPHSWNEVLEAIRVLTHEDHPYKTLVIDTLDWLEPLCWQHVCQLHGKQSIEDFGYGKGYVIAVEQWRILLGRLDMLVRSRRMHVVMVAHGAVRRVDDPQTGPFDRYRLKLHDKTSDVMREWVDAVLFARHEVVTFERNGKTRGRSSGARVMHTTWTAAYDAKNRFDLPETLPLSWEEFESAVRAHVPADAGKLRAELNELIPRLNDPQKAEKALREWAGDSPARLAQLLDKIRGKLALQESGEGSGETSLEATGLSPRRLARGYAGRMHRTALRALIVATALACVACGKRSNEVVKPFHPIPGQPDETPLWKEKQINKDRTDSEQTPSMVFWFWLLPVGGSAAWAALWEQLHRRRARAEKRSVAGGSLRNGSAVIQGVVETDGGDAITVVVTQKKKTFKDKQGHTHISWHESKRKVIARPFRVVLPDQQTIQVEPNARVHLRDKVEAPTLVDGDHRERRVRLQPRERVWVTGRLSGQASPGGGSAYREAPPTAVLRPERFRRMIVSTESPGAYFLERAAMYRLWKKGFLIAALVVHGTVFLDYTLLVLSGRPETTQIAAYKSWEEWVKPKNQAGRWVKHFAVDAQSAPGGERKEFEVSHEFHRCVERGGCQTIPTSKAWLTLGALQRPGRGPTLHIVQLVIPGVIGWVVALVYLYAVRSSRPWYAGGKINDGA